MAVVKMESLPEGAKIIKKKKNNVIKMDALPEGAKIVNKKDEGVGALDLLNLFDIVDAPIREGTIEAMKGPATGVGNVGEFIRGLGKHAGRYFTEGPIGAIKSTPSFSEITGDPISGTAMDIALAPTTYTGAGGLLKVLGKGAAGKAVKKGLSLPGKIPAVRKTGQKAMAQKLYQTVPKSAPEAQDIASIAETAYSHDDIVRLVNNPKELVELLDGSPTVETLKDVTTGTVAKKTVGRKGGLINQKVEAVNELLKGIQKGGAAFPGSIVKKDLLEKVVGELKIAGGGTGLKVPAQKKINKVINQIVKNEKSYNLTELNNMKRAINKVLSSKDFVLDSKSAENVDILKALLKGLDDQVSAAIEVNLHNRGFGAKEMAEAVAAYQTKNKEINNLIKLKAVMKNPAFEQMGEATKVDTVMAGLAGATTGGVLGGVVGQGGVGAAVGGGLGAYAASRGAFQSAQKALPGLKARTMKGIESGGLLDRFLPPASKVLPDEQQGRSPQSVIIEGLRAAKKPNIPDMIVNTKLPRSSEEIMGNTDFFLMKVAQEVPDAYDMVKNTMDNDPDALPEILPGLVEMAPHLFARDKYNRVDGKILSTEDQQRARKDTMKNDEFSLVEKMEIINRLNKTGEFDQ